MSDVHDMDMDEASLNLYEEIESLGAFAWPGEVSCWPPLSLSSLLFLILQQAGDADKMADSMETSAHNRPTITYLGNLIIFHPPFHYFMQNTFNLEKRKSAEEVDNHSNEEFSTQLRRYPPKLSVPPLYIFIRNLLHNGAFNPSGM